MKGEEIPGCREQKIKKKMLIMSRDPSLHFSLCSRSLGISFQRANEGTEKHGDDREGGSRVWHVKKGWSGSYLWGRRITSLRYRSLCLLLG